MKGSSDPNLVILIYWIVLCRANDNDIQKCKFHGEIGVSVKLNLNRLFSL
jgi:hypothetical protein